MNFNVKLTRRQTEVAEFVGFGYSAKEAASFLGISYSTIKVTLKAIYSKIGIQKATELAKFVYVRRFGLDAALCEPTRKLIAMFFLCLYVSSVVMEEDMPIARRTRTGRNNRIERVIRNRREYERGQYSQLDREGTRMAPR